MGLVLNTLQGLICYKTQTTNQTNKQPIQSIENYMDARILAIEQCLKILLQL